MPASDLAMLVLAPILIGATASVVPVGVHRPTDDECAVWQREMSFARSVAEHDAAAFAEHLAPDAVFAVGTPNPTRGRAAIAEAWAGIVRGDGLRLEWYPTSTTVSGDLAWSTGPALFERLDGRAPRLARSTFQSVWRRDAAGRWHVVFDTGTAPQPVDEASAAAFRAARPATCAAG
jgi:ketosteroid isomerase-like protein